MITLREDQLETIGKLRVALKDHQSVLIHAECGWGKTVAAAYLALGALQKNKRVIFAAHRKQLIRQTAKTFQRFGIPFGYIQAGVAPDPFAIVHIASAQTLANRPKSLKCDLFVPDEAHLWCSSERLDIINTVRAHGAKIVPLTATPEQGNGQGLSVIADAMIHGPSAEWLIERGLLAQYKAYAPARPDLSGLHTRQGEYIPAEVDELLGKPSITGSRVDAYLKYARGKRMVGYAYSRQNGHDTAAEFQSRGIGARFIDGDTPDHLRNEAIEAFADGAIQVLINVALLQEGFDLSAQVGRTVPIQAVGLWAPSRSLPKARQMMMRTMRAQEGHATILDHVNLLRDHGLPDSEYDWSLEGRVARKVGGEKTIPTSYCSKCAYTGKPFRICPQCRAERKIEGRQVEEVEGGLDEIDVEFMRRQQKLDIQRARNFEALVAVCVANNYKKGWLVHMMTIRGMKPKGWKPNSAEWREIENALARARSKAA